MVDIVIIDEEDPPTSYSVDKMVLLLSKRKAHPQVFQKDPHVFAITNTNVPRAQRKINKNTASTSQTTKQVTFLEVVYERRSENLRILPLPHHSKEAKQSINKENHCNQQQDNSEKTTDNVKSFLKRKRRDEELPCDSPTTLSRFKHILFVDLDNWGPFLRLSVPLPRNTYVWVFHGGRTVPISEKKWSQNFRDLLLQKRCFLHPKCSNRKNAADFAICVYIAKCDCVLKKDIQFTVLSGDSSFQELGSQIHSRKLTFVNPHDPKFKNHDILYTLLSNMCHS
ncbi:E3 SUMO-protein ligase ZNF451-like [Xenia sp. Carnegie-2017]|uniref:E3 SUMO-protein ligase ZNF451-like n=1 Tax=Xenia sp. Carnegie-2017 TaxID=2897299 RepID=UPI001F0502CB|nr:E3 SUMO-protein ligase ZNF451-like [Xenia sp. Carnegie-2017]